MVLGGDYLSYGKCDQVTMPNTEAVRFAVGRLLDTGVRTIAVIGASPDMHGWEDVRDQRDGTQSLRIQGYVQAHEERGLTVDWRYVIPLLGWNPAWRCAGRGIHAGFVAVPSGGAVS